MSDFDLQGLYENSQGFDRWMLWLSLWILWLLKYIVYALGIITLIALCVCPFVGLIFGIKQIKIKFKQHKQNKKDRKQLEDQRQNHNKQYFEKLDKLLEPHKKNKHK